MAIYRLRYKCGKKALEHLSYINGEEKYSTKREHIEYTETKNLPENFKDIQEFWKYAIVYERKNANIYREFEITLPKEFNKEKNKEILDRFLEKTFENKYVYNYAMHNPGGEQPHAHIMFCDRKLDEIERKKENFFKRYNPQNPENGGLKKDRSIKKKDYVKDIRKNWEKHLNLYLEAEGIEKVSSDTLIKQREKAIEKGDIVKAELLNRDAIHVTHNLKYKDKEKNTAYDLYQRIQLEDHRKEKQLQDEVDRIYKLNFMKRKYNEKMKEFQNYTFEKVLEEKEKIEIDIFRLSKKMLDRTLESEALNILSEGKSNEYKNEKNHLFKMIKNDRLNKSKYKKRINEINKEIENFKIENKEKIIDKKLELKAKYMKPFKFKIIEKEIVDKIFMDRLKKTYGKDNDEINLYKAYIERKNLRDEKLIQLKNIEINKKEIDKYLNRKDYKSAKNIQRTNGEIYKNIKSLDRINKKFRKDIKVQEQILKHGEFILDEYKNILDNEEELERE
ncbi:MobA/MobL family protein [Streptobacillus moniliformis]|uniref:MobA/MobL family protein n=1 Tax=Streptobacillus moniliformis TaxID=34105 RepID=UPI0007E3F301|nr:MobA/MobL family protein [Streptobacillus moniliformis]